MTGHDAQPQRRSTGHSRWYATCPCGWRRNADSQDAATRAAADHNAVAEVLRIAEDELYERCYEPETMEYYDGKCARCRARELLGSVLRGAA